MPEADGGGSAGCVWGDGVEASLSLGGEMSMMVWEPWWVSVGLISAPVYEHAKVSKPGVSLGSFWVSA